MANTKIRPEQAGIPSGGSTGEGLVKQSNTDYDVVWGAVSGGGSGGGGLATYTAAEDLTIGDPVGTSVGDADSVALANLYEKSVALSGSTPANSSRAEYIGNNTFAVVYGAGGTASAAISIFEVDRATMTITEVHQQGLGVGNIDDIDICWLGTVGKFLVAYALDGSNNGEVLVGEWDGVSLSLGTDVVIDGSGDVGSVRCTAFGTDRAAVAFQRQVPNTTYVSVVTVAGTVPTDVANDTIAGTAYADGVIDMVQIATEKFVIATDNNFVRAYEFTAPSTLTAGADQTVNVVVRPFLASSGTDGKFMISGAPSTELHYCSVTGVVVTVEDTLALTTTSTYGGGIICKDVNTFYLYESENSLVTSKVFKVTISGGNTIDTPTIMGSRVAPMTGGEMVNMVTEDYFIIADQASTIQYFIEGMSGNFIGFAQATVGRGGSISVLTGGIDTNQTGIESGTIYEVTDGTLVATGDITVPFKVLGRSSTDVQMPGGGSGVVNSGDQSILTTRETGPASYAINSSTSTTNGLECFVTAYYFDQTRPVIYRYEKDLETGMYYMTHTATDGSSIDDTGLITPIVVLGNYLYVAGRNGANLEVHRFDKADLLNGTTMTVPAVVFAPSAAFTDGTNLFFVEDATGDVREYSVSGTTLSFVQTLTGGMANCVAAFYDTGIVYMIDNTNTIQSFTISGATLVAGSSIQRNFLTPIVQSTNNPPQCYGMFYTNSTTFNYIYVQEWSEATSGGSTNYWTAIVKTFSRPV